MCEKQGYEANTSNETNNECKRYLGAWDVKQKYGKCTELSKCHWTLKSHGITPIVNWSIVKRIRSKKSANYCKLFLTEKVYII